MKIAIAQFSLLPPELRFQIWHMTMEPRLLRVNVGFCKTVTPVADWSPYGNPIALRVCQESRALALARYPIAWGVYDCSRRRTSAYRFAKRYINLQDDIVLIDVAVSNRPHRRDAHRWRYDHYHFLVACLTAPGVDPSGAPISRNLRNLALSAHFWFARVLPQGGLKVCEQLFSNSREVYIVSELKSEEQRDRALSRTLFSINRQCLRAPGWKVELEEHTVKVTRVTETGNFISHVHCGNAGRFSERDFPSGEPQSDTLGKEPPPSDVAGYKYSHAASPNSMPFDAQQSKIYTWYGEQYTEQRRKERLRRILVRPRGWLIKMTKRAKRLPRKKKTLKPNT
ncbi:hypothetical protein GGR57DRAFT_230039 [Xylariaceae sp. FL1272]|nr:hypothetical protein GGR57DRAFT_230039 [Xylariaceae sp. FL1272]